MKDTQKIEQPKLFSHLRNFLLKLTFAGLLLAMPAIVSAQCIFVVTNPPSVCFPTTVNLTLPAVTAGSDAGLTLTYWTNAEATVVLANPAAVSVSGTYYIKAVNSGTCSVIRPVNVTIFNPVLPNFNPIGPLCQNTIPPVLPLVSINGVAGTWNPATINTATAGMAVYTFTPAAGQCATNLTMTVIVNPLVVPVFNPIGSVCSGAAAPVLPLISNNGITGTWNPAVVSSTTTGTYTFTPTAGQCATPAAITVTVKPVLVPVFAPIGPYCVGNTAPALPLVSTNGITGTWSPAVINTSALGIRTHVFTPDAGQCSVVIILEVAITSQLVPVFAAIGPFCLGSTPPSLPAASLNGITGIWSPAVISTAVAGNSTYAFTPYPGQCGIASTITVTVRPPVGPAVISGPATRCQGAAAVMYLASSIHASSISFYLDAASSIGGNTVNQATGVVTFSAGWTGSTVITAVAEGCNGPAISNFTVITHPAPAASILYVGSPYCKTLTGKMPVALTGTNGGIFSAAPAGLVIDPANGDITPSASEPGHYIVSYKVGTAIGCSEVTATAQVTIASCLLRPVTVTASIGQNKVAGSPDPVFTYYYTPNLEPGDQFTGRLSREPGETPGNYQITLGTLTAGPDYQITFLPATFEIIAAAADAYLSDLKVDGTTIGGFSPGILIYELIFTPGTTRVPVITATARNTAATALVQPALSIPGTTRITVTSADRSRQLTYEVKMTVQSTGIDQAPDGNVFSVYPNPNHGTFNIEFLSPEPGSVRMSVLDLTGKILSDRWYYTDSGISEVVRIPEPRSGIYVIRLVTVSGVSFRKIVVE